MCIGVLSDMVAEEADDISTAILPHATALIDLPQNAKHVPVLPKWRPRDGKDEAYELFRDALETALIDHQIDPAAVDYPSFAGICCQARCFGNPLCTSAEKARASRTFWW